MIGVPKRFLKTGATGLEPAASGVTGRRSNQLSYAPGARRRGERVAPGRAGEPARLILGIAPRRASRQLRSERGVRAGLLRDDSVVDIWDALGGGGPGVRELLASGRLAELDARRATIRCRSAEVELLAAGPRSGEDRLHRAQLPRPRRRGGDRAARVADLLRQVPQRAARPPGATVALPAASAKVDFEAEIAFVVGRRARDVAESDGIDHVAGYMLFNDLSARDLQFATPQWMPGKVFDGSAPCGPALVTPDEAGPDDGIAFSLT